MTLHITSYHMFLHLICLNFLLWCIPLERFLLTVSNINPTENRFTPIYDFGYVAMNFGWVYPEDSGEYLCRATNLYGMDETRAIIKTAGKPGIIYESQLPKGMKSIERIREMEAAWQV